MRSDRTSAVYYDEILTAITILERYCAGLSFEAFVANPEKQDSIFYRLMVLTEAAHRLRPNELVLCPAPDWRKIRDLGNVLRHAYDSVNLLQVWGILNEQLPPLKHAVEQTMREHFPDVSRA